MSSEKVHMLLRVCGKCRKGLLISPSVGKIIMVWCINKLHNQCHGICTFTAKTWRYKFWKLLQVWVQWLKGEEKRHGIAQLRVNKFASFLCLFWWLGKEWFLWSYKQWPTTYEKENDFDWIDIVPKWNSCFSSYFYTCYVVTNIIASFICKVDRNTVSIIETFHLYRLSPEGRFL